MNDKNLVKKAVNLNDLNKVIVSRGFNEFQFKDYIKNLFGDENTEAVKKLHEQLVEIFFHPNADEFNMFISQPLDSGIKHREINIILKNGSVPVYSTPRSSGADIRTNEDFILKRGERKMIHTGIYMQLPEDVEAQVRPRSGLSLKYGITVLNSPGTIDSDYQGECNVILINHGDSDCRFSAGDRIAQFVFVEKIIQADFKIVDKFSETTERGDGGFGHTGIE